jgi:hypothetical protein
MSSTDIGKKILSAAGRILLLVFAVIGALKLGPPASYLDSYGIIFVLSGGIAMVLISFPGGEIGRAFRHAAGGSGSNTELRNSAHFWEAAGRGFWILGGLRSVLSIVIGFSAMATEEFAGMPVIWPMLIKALLSTFYGSLLAVICFIPCWKLMGKLPSRLSAQSEEPQNISSSNTRPGWSFGTIGGYVLFLIVLITTVRIPNADILPIWSSYNPAMLVVLGGTLALILFINGSNTKLTSSAAFAGMGLIGSLIGFIQMLHAMTNNSPQGIAYMAGALVFVLSSCFTALLGIVLIGAPLEDRAIRMGRSIEPSAFSRVAWYVFPLLSLIFLILVFNMIIMPLPH